MQTNTTLNIASRTTRPFGWTGQNVATIGQGTWMVEQDDDDQVIDALRLGIDLGMSLIDTAEMYGDGRAEEVVGRAIAGRRGEVFLVSKVLPSHASYEGTLRACEQSLQRLNTSYLDVYLLHWPGEYPIAETMRAMEELVQSGMTRYIGVSNFDLDQLQSAQATLRHHRLACNQVLYHLKDRGIERKLVPYMKEQGIALMGYSPFGHDDLPKTRSKGRSVLSQIASDHDRTIRQVILNFLIRDGAFVIPKSGKPEHVRENSEAQDWTLTEDESAAIDAAFPVPDHDTPLGML